MYGSEGSTDASHARILPLIAALACSTPPLVELTPGDGDMSVDWPLRGGNHSEQHFSPLAEIDTASVRKLGLSWSVDVPSIDGLIATPIVVDRTIFVSGSFGMVFAFDATSGRLKWSFDPAVRRDLSINSSWATRVNRGVAVADGRVFVGTGDCRLIAIDSDSGKALWDREICESENFYAITGAPRIGGDLVFMGSGGSDHGARGFAAAFRQDTGEEVWRFHTVPGDPKDGFENPAMELAAKTWSGPEPWKFGGGAVWSGITYDEELGQVYLGVAGGSPWDPTVRSPDGGDNLFLCSVVAVDARTGEYRWHYQTVPRDAWDFDASTPMALATIEIEGRDRKVLLQAPKNGFFYVLDRETGELIQAAPYVPVTWADSIDLTTGRPNELPGARYHENESGEATVYPSIWGAHNWQPMSFSPETGLVYIPALNFPTVFRTERGAIMGGIFADLYGHDPHDPALPKDLGKLIAWDPIRGKERWRVDYALPFNGGTLATSGGVVFQGTAAGELHAFAAEDGRRLWSTQLGSAVQAAPVTYRYGGEQYVLVAAGWGGSPRTMTPAYAATLDAQGPARLFAYRIGADAPMPVTYPSRPPIPQPPLPRTEDPSQVALGEKLFEAMACSTCHGQGAVGAGPGGSIPDLRYASETVHEDWESIILGGARSRAGMLPFDKYLTRAQVAALRAFVLDVAWDWHLRDEKVR